MKEFLIVIAASILLFAAVWIAREMMEREEGAFRAPATQAW
jgi:hypothetical protein